MTDVLAYTTDAPVLAVDGEDVGALGRDLRRLDVEEGTLGLRTLVAHVHADGPDSDGSADELAYIDGDIIDLGSELAATIGSPGRGQQIFRGVVSSLEVSFDEGTAPFVSIYAEDALMRLRMRERTASWVDTNDADIAADIASSHGMGAQVDVDGPTYPIVQQFEQSDLAFLRDRAMRLNAELWVDDDDVLHLADRGQRDGERIELVQGNDLISARVRVDLSHQRSQVTFRGWDDQRVEAVAETADEAVVQAEVSRGRVGPLVAADVFDEPVLSRSRRDVLTAASAQTYAEAELLRRARSFVCIEGVTNGTPGVVPGAQLDLSRVGNPFDGDGYRVIWAHHSYDLSSGYRTMFRAERPELRQ